jgi:multidrug efflux system membrane fusion protein
MKTTRWIFLTLLILGLGGGLVWRARAANAKQAEDKKPKGQQSVPIVASEVIRKEMPVWLSGIGTVQASNTVTVRPRVGGTLESVAFTEGAIVKEGDVLAQIDPRPFRSVLAQAEAKKAQDEAQLANANATLTRSQSLVKENAVSKQVLDQSEAAAGQFAALVKSDQALVDAAQLDLDFTTVRAPISGRTGVRMVDAGNVVTASQAEGLVVVTELQPVSVIFTLPQRYLPQLRPHMKPGATPLVAQAVDDDGTVLDEGKLELVDNQIDTSTGNLRLKATFQNSDYTLWPGQFVTSRVLVDTLKNPVVVPAEVVQPGLDGPFAYVIKKDATVDVRNVKTGMTLDGLIVIDEGLEPGDRVVRDGQSKLKPGSRVSEKKAES